MGETPHGHGSTPSPASGSGDLSQMSFPTEFHTVRVHNYKDDPYQEHATLHGLFTSKDEAAKVAHDLRLTYPDFLTAEVSTIQFATVEQIARVQGFTPTGTDAGIGGEQSEPPPAGSYLNPTRESIAAEVAADQEVREQLRREAKDLEID